MLNSKTDTLIPGYW